MMDKIQGYCTLPQIFLSHICWKSPQFYKNHASISSTAIGDEYQVAKSRQDGSYTQEAGGGGTAMFLDAPSTTEEITYTVFAKINSGSNGRIGQNNHGSTITVMEVLA